MNSPAAPQGKGYEIDKANAELARFHFEKYMGEIIRRIPEENLPALKYVVADSYEMGSQNWTNGFGEKFKDKFGYDPVPYLPVLSGRIVSSVEESDRFLWDLRRAVADDVACEYVGGLRKASNDYGLKLWLENYGHWGFPSEFLMYGGQTDLVSGEFWNEGPLGNIECKSASSAGHIYEKPVISAEAFTASRMAYARHPALLKKRGDWSFTEGINHLVLHLYIQQPRDEPPGINAWFSTEFNRLNTWFEMGHAWVDYIRRCQHMLQQGRYSADILYFIGEDVPKMTGTRDPELPAGYSYDYINAEVILNRLSVRNGQFILPDGMTYSILALPEKTNMRPEVLTKLEELVEAGGTILGRKPKKSPSLMNYPECDVEVAAIAGRLWGETDGSGPLRRSVGKGYVLRGIPLKEALEFIGVSPDLEPGTGKPFLWTHRTLPGMEIYFLTNQGEEILDFRPSFRVHGLQPQYWDAVTGKTRQLNDYSREGKRTIVPLRLQPLESCFIVFTSATTDDIGPGYPVNSPEPETVMTLDVPWEIEFRNEDIGPPGVLRLQELVDWTRSEDDRIRYYSGTATYSARFMVDRIPEGDLVLDLGKVGMMAEARLNGTDLGACWIFPYRLEIGSNLVEGENRLEIEVVNIWRNRIVGDLSLPPDERYTTYLISDARPGEPLKPSGLMGPVTIGRLR
jgi:hypothetical protein